MIIKGILQLPENMPETRINVFNDSPARVQTPAQQTPQVEYASLMERFVALLIDYGLIMIPGQVILMLATRNMELEMPRLILKSVRRLSLTKKTTHTPKIHKPQCQCSW